MIQQFAPTSPTRPRGLLTGNPEVALTFGATPLSKAMTLPTAPESPASGPMS
jgi:hypothetical protein